MNGYYKFLEQLIPSCHSQYSNTGSTSAPLCQYPRDGTGGSGTIIDAAGHILTVGYVVLGAETITVTPQQGQSLPADIVHIDFESGLAVLRADFPDAPTMLRSLGYSRETSSSVSTNEAVTDRPAFYERLWQHQAGKEVVLALMRDGRRHILLIVSQDRNVFYA